MFWIPDHRPPPAPSAPGRSGHPARRIAVVVVLGFLAAGCDPIVNFYGSFFPAWVVCLMAGVSLASGLRWVLAVTRLEPHLGPLVLIYPALAFLLSAAAWLIFFGP